MVDQALTISSNFRSTVTNDKIKAPFDSRPGVVYEIKYGCNASYIRETGDILLHRFGQHMKNVLTYKYAERTLNGEPATGPGCPQTTDPRKAMEKAISASVIVEHASRRIMEALYIKNNSTINRDNGIAASEAWAALINKFQCCALLN
ncbi:hypothetical protein TTRE_0000273901 [Trichuris trichiura]|uniref:Uncharacterized protein n=1 Tax=Trichuris trichiura TaxID=36087 RepID=A0A077Z3N9_TRITR|nr:hypothetical protein TTRE_0000273901 [Trichuris trichiura]